MNNIGKILFKFDEYRKDIKNVWEEYLLLNYSLSNTKSAHKLRSIGADFKREHLIENITVNYKDKDIHHFIDRLVKHKLGYKTLVEAVSLTENYLQNITGYIYSDFPIKLTNSNPDTPASELKLTSLIVSSNSKEEMIEAIIEEKIRSIFYGKPTDFFTKDKAKVGLGDHIKTDFDKAIKQYGEITARRNIIIHNSGKVDSKYIREVSATTFKKGAKVPVDKDYLKNAVIVLRGLSAMTTHQAIKNTYNGSVDRHRVAKMSKTLLEYLK
jgi:hypothetical protein